MKITPEILDQLVQRCRDAGLPLPPAEAPLILTQTREEIHDDEHDWSPLYVPGFQIKAGQSGTFLVGTETYAMESSPDEEVSPEPDVDPEQPVTFELEDRHLPGDEKETFSRPRERYPDYIQLDNLGFAAMPALIEHMDDPRLTRILESPMGYSPVMATLAGKLYMESLRGGRGQPSPPSTMTRVGELIAPLVYGAAGGAVARGWLAQQSEGRSVKEQARQWWEEASKADEETYLCDQVFPADKRRQSINLTSLNALAARYPARLGQIYRRLLAEWPGLFGGAEIVAAISANEKLSREEKLRLLHEGMDHPALGRREEALVGLLQLDPPDAEARLIAEFDRLPTEMPPTHHDSPVVQIAAVVKQTGSPAVWQAFERAARRVDPALRIELLSAVRHRSVPGPQREAEQLRLLAAFLDDGDVRVCQPNPQARHPFDGPVLWSQYPRISVQNFAAMEIAGALGCRSPEEDWDEAEWTQYREGIGAEAKRRSNHDRIDVL